MGHKYGRFGMPEFLRAVDEHINKFNSRPDQVVLTVPQYLDLLDDVFGMQPPPPTGNRLLVPALNVVQVPARGGLVFVRPITDGGAILATEHAVLKVVGQMFSNTQPAGVTGLNLGPHVYPVSVPYNASSTIHATWMGSGPVGFVLQNQGGSVKLTNPVSPADTVTLPPGAENFKVDNRATEPECLCDSRTLASTGHEFGCAWMRWKSRGGK